MAEPAHELAPHHLPFFVPSADGSDPLMTVMLIVLIIGVVLLGTFYLHLHSLPERLAHRHSRMQFELVAVLGLLALFTHNMVFWVAALLLAFVPFPDFSGPLNSIAASLDRIAARQGGDKQEEQPAEALDDDDAEAAAEEILAGPPPEQPLAPEGARPATDRTREG